MDSDKALMDIKWPELQSRRDEHTFKLVNKCISGNCPQFFKQYFNFNNTRTRQRNLLHLPRVRTEQPRNLFIIMYVLFIKVKLIRIFYNILY